MWKSPDRRNPRTSSEKLLQKSGLKKQPKHKVFGRDIPGASRTQTSGYPGQKLYATGIFQTGSGRDVPGFGSGRPGFGKTFSRRRQVTDLDVAVLGFSGPGLPFARQVLCGDAPRLFSIILVCI